MCSRNFTFVGSRSPQACICTVFTFVSSRWSCLWQSWHIHISQRELSHSTETTHSFCRRNSQDEVHHASSNSKRNSLLLIPEFVNDDPYKPKPSNLMDPATRWLLPNLGLPRRRDAKRRDSLNRPRTTPVEPEAKFVQTRYIPGVGLKRVCENKLRSKAWVACGHSGESCDMSTGHNERLMTSILHRMLCDE